MPPLIGERCTELRALVSADEHTVAWGEGHEAEHVSTCHHSQSGNCTPLGDRGTTDGQTNGDFVAFILVPDRIELTVYAAAIS